MTKEGFDNQNDVNDIYEHLYILEAIDDDNDDNNDEIRIKSLN